MDEPNQDGKNLEIPKPVPVTPEMAPVPEQAAELSAEVPQVEPVPVRETAEAEATAVIEVPRVMSVAKTEAAPAPYDPTTMKVERVLEADLWDIYIGLPEDFRAIFLSLGQTTALAIRAQIAMTHVRASRIHDLVHKWLKKIPGVNEFFLLQESKIKTDQFMRLAAWLLTRGGHG